MLIIDSDCLVPSVLISVTTDTGVCEINALLGGAFVLQSSSIKLLSSPWFRVFSFTDVVGPGIKKCVYFADTGSVPQRYVRLGFTSVQVIVSLVDYLIYIYILDY